MTTGVWHHFAIVRGGTTLSLYVDGALAGSDTAFGFSFDNSKPVNLNANGTVQQVKASIPMGGNDRRFIRLKAQ